MADGTNLNPGSGGDVIHDETIAGSTTSADIGQKMPVSQLAIGPRGIHGGIVGPTVSLPVESTEIEERLGRIIELLTSIDERLQVMSGTL
jgi:hypothetical protein